MGDSFSAGNGNEGLTPFSNSIQWCFRHNNAWGGQAVDVLRNHYPSDNLFTYTNRACSGSKIQHVAEEYAVRTDKNGQCYPDEEGLRIEQVFENDVFACQGWEVFTKLFEGGCPKQVGCSNSVRPQIEEVGTHIDIVMITMGANDVGMEDLVTNCFIPNVLYIDFGCNAATDKATGIITDTGPNGLYEKTKAMLALLRSKMKPTARVVLVEYPYLSIEAKPVLGIYPEYKNRADRVRELGRLATEVQRRAIQDSNRELQTDVFHFFDRSAAIFAEHEANPGRLELNLDGYLNEFNFLVQCPRGVIDGNDCLKKNVMLQLYHPNTRGHKALGTDPNLGVGKFLIDEVMPHIISDRQSLLQQSRLRQHSNAMYPIYPDSAIDVVVLIDSSLSDILNILASNIGDYIDKFLASITDNWRAGIAKFGCNQSDTYVVQAFTNNASLIEAAVGSIQPTDPCNNGSLLLPSMRDILELPWFSGGVTSEVIVLTGSKLSQGTAAEIDSIIGQIHDLNVYFNFISYNNTVVGPNSDIAYIAAKTNGNLTVSSAEPGVTVGVIGRWIEGKATNPVADFKDVGNVALGSTVSFNAESSYDPKRLGIVSYHWNMMNGKTSGKFVTTTPKAEFTYKEEYKGYVELTVETSDGRTSSVKVRPIIVTQYGLYPGTCRFEENGELSMNNPSDCFEDTSTSEPTDIPTNVPTSSPTSSPNGIQKKKKIIKKSKTSRA